MGCAGSWLLGGGRRRRSSVAWWMPSSPVAVDWRPRENIQDELAKSFLVWWMSSWSGGRSIVGSRVDASTVVARWLVVAIVLAWQEDGSGAKIGSRVGREVLVVLGFVPNIGFHIRQKNGGSDRDANAIKRPNFSSKWLLVVLLPRWSFFTWNQLCCFVGITCSQRGANNMPLGWADEIG